MRLIIINEQVRRRGIELLRDIPLDPPHEITIKVHKKIRNLVWNDKMWAILTDIADQVTWYDQKLTKEEWKDIFTAAVKKQKVVPGIDGGFVVIGAHTSKMNNQEIIDVIECATAFGSERGVVWKEVFYKE